MQIQSRGSGQLKTENIRFVCLFGKEVEREREGGNKKAERRMSGDAEGERAKQKQQHMGDEASVSGSTITPGIQQKDRESKRARKGRWKSPQ